MLKDAVKNVIGSIASPLEDVIIVNSYGRSGSTLLWNAIGDSCMPDNKIYGRKWVNRSIKRTAWDLDCHKFWSGGVYKTHDYPPRQILQNNIKIVYIYADPVRVVQSLIRLYSERGEDWMREHFAHLKRPYRIFDDIIDEDILGLEEHLDAWLQEMRWPILFVRYEVLWDCIDEISRFLGLQVKLPAYRPRKGGGSAGNEKIKKLKQTYCRLQRRVLELEDCFTNGVGDTVITAPKGK